MLIISNQLRDMMTTFNDFLAWEAHTRDTLDVKKIYIDMANDLMAGIALSEIVFWHLPNKDGESKMRVKRAGHIWIAIPRWEWWERTRMTPRQSDRVLKVLRASDLIITQRWKWRNTPTVHIRINTEVFLQKWSELTSAHPLPNPYLPDSKIEVINDKVKSVISPDGEIDLPDSLNLKTETTDSEITTKEKPLTDQQLMVQAICEALSIDYHYLTKDQGGVIGKTASQIRAAHGTPEQIPRFMVWLKKKAEEEHWSKTPDEHSMRTHWAKFATQDDKPSFINFDDYQPVKKQTKNDLTPEQRARFEALAKENTRELDRHKS
jgi:hypothetical protein